MALNIFVYALHYSCSIPQQVVDSRVESVLWQSALVEKAYYYLAEKR